jgi:hypothetical protein
MGYVLTAEVLADLRVFLQRATGAREALVKRHALDLLGHLDHADSLDAKRLHELATWAREQARERDASSAHRILGADDAPFDTVALGRVMAEDSRIIEISTDVLTALALDSLPAGAVLNIGRDEEQVNAKSLRWPSKYERAASLRIDMNSAGDECHLCQAAIADEDAATCTSAGCPRRAALEVEPAANGAMSRVQVEALPSHDRVVLVRIFESLLGVPDSSPRKADASASAEDVWDELEATRVVLADHLAAEGASWPDIIRITARLDGDMLKLARERDEARHALTAPRYSLPGSHPLRQYQWAEWLGALIRREEPSECWSPNAERLAVLRAALARVEQLDVDGLDGLAFRVGSARAPVLQPDELALLRVACARVAIDSSGGAASRGQHRVPRVRGETVEVGS